MTSILKWSQSSINIRYDNFSDKVTAPAIAVWSDKMTEKKSITIRLEPKTKDKLNLICAVKDITINEFISQLIYDEFRKDKVQSEIKKHFDELNND